MTAADDGCSARPGGRGVVVTASVSAPDPAFVSWDYVSPDGTPHRVRNCSVADLDVRLIRRGGEPVDLTAGGRAVYELGRREAVRSGEWRPARSSTGPAR